MITLDEFIKGVADQFEDTDPSEIKADTCYHELEEWSSLVAMTLVAYVKIEFNQTLSGADIQKARTFEDLYKIICSK